MPDWPWFEKVGDLDLEIHSGPGNVRCEVTAVWHCLDCGGLVGDREAHKNWHARIDGQDT
jgi:hypothetical protein